MSILDPLPAYPSRAILLMPNGQRIEIAISHCDIYKVFDPYQTKVEITGRIDDLALMRQSSEGEPVDAGGEYVVLRCPKCDHLDEGHDCDTSEAPAVTPVVPCGIQHHQWTPVPSPAPSDPTTQKVTTHHCVRPAGHPGEHTDRKAFWGLESLTGLCYATVKTHTGTSYRCTCRLGHAGNHLTQSGFAFPNDDDPL